MLDTVKVLLLSPDENIFLEKYPEYVKIYTQTDEFDTEKREEPDMVFICRKLLPGEEEFLKKYSQAYTLFVTNRFFKDVSLEELVKSKCAQRVENEKVAEYIRNEAKNYFPKPYGEKYMPENLSISPFFKGNVIWKGHSCVELEGDFGSDFRQIAFYRNCIPILVDQALDFWMEYDADEGVEIQLEFSKYARGQLSTLEKRWLFNQKELEDIVTVDNPGGEGMLFVSIKAKGKGTLKLITLNDRYSRRGHGCFLPGGERKVSSKREEVFSYFDPGDLKPPLNVYFSGYKTKQGFEGYNFMRSLGCPFLLISEPRLDGGAAYMGDNEYEDLLVASIKEAMEILGFTPDQVILTGLSMGALGALYYASSINPHAVVVGKPLTNIGDIAANEKLVRPGGFPTSLDWLYFHTGDTSKEAEEKINSRFWEKFEKGDFSKTQFAISYMIEDDYDRNAYQNILSHLASGGVQVFGKGLHGRHNDETNAIVEWFGRRCREIISRDFGRKI